jgi:hypothetical protein
MMEDTQKNVALMKTGIEAENGCFGCIQLAVL